MTASLLTSHQIILGDARSLGGVDNASVDLVVLSVLLAELRRVPRPVLHAPLA